MMIPPVFHRFRTVVDFRGSLYRKYWWLLLPCLGFSGSACILAFVRPGYSVAVKVCASVQVGHCISAILVVLFRGRYWDVMDELGWWVSTFKLLFQLGVIGLNIPIAAFVSSDKVGKAAMLTLFTGYSISVSAFTRYPLIAGFSASWIGFAGNAFINRCSVNHNFWYQHQQILATNNYRGG
ncbi:hypothetical protein LINGRAHAP2_LOCUS19987 [Linum grandiflorum]